MTEPAAIRLVVSDVDGTLVNTAKVLGPATIAAAHRLREAGIHLALVSSRPPRGMVAVQRELGLTGPLGGFNGGTILAPDGSVIEQNAVPVQAVRIMLDLLARRGIAAWLFADDQWIITDPHGDYVPKERHTVGFEPTVVDDVTPFIARCGKVVGVTTDFDLLAACETELQTLLHGTANAHRSQKYYLDLTHPAANKGTALHAIAKWYGIDPTNVAAIGDMANDVAMFDVAGLSIAMGNAPPAVAAKAMQHTGSNETTGWADAMDRLLEEGRRGLRPSTPPGPSPGLQSE